MKGYPRVKTIDIRKGDVVFYEYYTVDSSVDATIKYNGYMVEEVVTLDSGKLAFIVGDMPQEYLVELWGFMEDTVAKNKNFLSVSEITQPQGKYLFSNDDTVHYLVKGGPRETMEDTVDKMATD